MATLEERGVQFDGTIGDQIDARMAVLVGTGQLEAAGNIKRWRYSEVRLRGAPAEAAEQAQGELSPAKPTRSFRVSRRLGSIKH